MPQSTMPKSTKPDMTKPMPKTMPKPMPEATKCMTASDYFMCKMSYEMTPYALKEMLDKKAKDICIVDVRSREMVAECHIPTAMNVPLAELCGAMETLPKDKTIVACCGGMTCGMATKACALLAMSGFSVMQLMGGMEEWTKKGYSIAKK